MHGVAAAYLQALHLQHLILDAVLQSFNSVHLSDNSLL